MRRLQKGPGQVLVATFGVAHPFDLAIGLAPTVHHARIGGEVARRCKTLDIPDLQCDGAPAASSANGAGPSGTLRNSCLKPFRLPFFASALRSSRVKTEAIFSDAALAMMNWFTYRNVIPGGQQKISRFDGAGTRCRFWFANLLNSHTITQLLGS